MRINLLPRPLIPETPGDIRREIEAVRAEGANCHRQVDQLEADRIGAATYEAAQAFDERIRSLRWQADAAAARLAPLKAKLLVAQDEVRAAAAVRFHARRSKISERLRRALTETAAIQDEARRLCDDAAKELGSSVAQFCLAPLAYAGFVLPDLVAGWTSQEERTDAAPQRLPPVRSFDEALAIVEREDRIAKNARQRAPAPISLVLHGDVGKGPVHIAGSVGMPITPHGSISGVRPSPGGAELRAAARNAAPVPRAREKLADDLAPLEKGSVRVRVMRDGYPDTDGHPRGFGAVIRIDADTAETAAMNNAIEIIEKPTPQ